VKLYHSSRDYLTRAGSPRQGLDVDAFCGKMERCFAELLASPAPDRSIVPDEALLPEIALDPAPAEWPDPAAFVPDEDEAHEGGDR
jgi:hypothetical protein